MMNLIPQMSPMMWFSLFIMFSMTMMLFNQLNFFSYKPNKIMSSNNKFKKKTLIEYDNKSIFNIRPIN
uniref:ATP synthase complex subunit 8 n=1 Tax=Locusta migratoria TaxID=7004 RepID=B6RMT0_LOCMI|nr:ATPase 8 [Locusta migratoria]